MFMPSNGTRKIPSVKIEEMTPMKYRIEETEVNLSSAKILEFVKYLSPSFTSNPSGF